MAHLDASQINAQAVLCSNFVQVDQQRVKRQTQAAGRSSCSAVSTRPVAPGGRGVHGWDLFCFWFVLARASVANVELFGCNPFSFGFRTRLKGFASSESPDLRKQRSCLCRRVSSSFSRSQPHPPADLHSWRFMPPVCTGAVVVTGSDTRSQESGRPCAHKLAACAPDCLLVPLVGRWTP